jgi:hypothetical protein
MVLSSHYEVEADLGEEEPQQEVEVVDPCPEGCGEGSSEESRTSLPEHGGQCLGGEPMTIEYRGEKFAGYNKPKRTPNAKKSHAVLAKEGDKVKLIRFGQQGVSGSPKRAGESEADRKRRESFKARHAANIKKGKMSAAYWADKVKW